MRILVVSQYFWPENFRVNDLAAELVRRGHDVSVLTGLPNYPEGQVYQAFRDAPSRFSDYEGVKVVRVPIAARGKGALRLLLNYLSFVVSGSLLGAWKLRGQAFDRIFVFEPSPITVGIPAIVMRFLKRAPIVFWVLDLWPDSLRAVGAVSSQRILDCVGLLVRFVYRYSDVILVQSRSFISHVQRYCANSAKIRYFPSWAEGEFADASGDPAPELARFNGSFNILFAGNIGEAQDFPAILGAAEALRLRTDVKWILVGDGRMASWVKERIAQLGLGETVFLLGRFDLQRMPSFYRAADALLVTLKQSEIFALTIPGKLQSYLAAGRPLLGMLDGEGNAVIHDSGAGLACAAGDSAALAEAAAQMADASPQRRVEMGQAGRRYYLDNFERGKLMSEMEQVLERASMPRRGT